MRSSPVQFSFWLSSAEAALRAASASASSSRAASSKSFELAEWSDSGRCEAEFCAYPLVCDKRHGEGRARAEARERKTARIQAEVMQVENEKLLHKETPKGDDES